MARALTCDVPGLRLDRFLAEKLEGYSRGAAQKLIERGLVRVDGKPGQADMKLREGALVEIEEARQDWDLELTALHEDSSILVINKPAGLLMHPLGESWLSAAETSLHGEMNLAGILYKRGLSKVPRCGIVHRLDRPTSGVLVVAKTKAAYESLVEAFKNREMDKTYRAIVRGIPSDARVEAPIGRKPGHRKVEVTPFGKTAQTHIKVVEAAKNHALVEAKPLTGRTHQIRAHLALVGHPVAGDNEFEAAGARPKAPRLMLHAYKLSFEHPKTGETLAFTAPYPRDFKEFWKTLKR